MSTPPTPFYITGGTLVAEAKDPTFLAVHPNGEILGARVRPDGRVLITRFVDPEVHGRYGFMVYVRCGAEGTRPAAPPT